MYTEKKKRYECKKVGDMLESSLSDKIRTSEKLLEVVEIMIGPKGGQLSTVGLKIYSSICALFLDILSRPLTYILDSAEFVLKKLCL